MKTKKITTLLFSILAIFILVISCSESDSDCPTKTCGDFATHAEAQAAFNSNRSCYKNLDADGDGIACE
ncbi:excalibur calcium-binding domain-containing protein [Flavobacterium sp. RS13.1]|jgi:hypothetical protein|uniref:excalibur calcium-binding domain-containing protein n=1 Tax=Flavobacterium sp. RS13.1 TaxID=3400345 RepID=UPI003AAA4A97